MKNFGGRTIVPVAFIAMHLNAEYYPFEMQRKDGRLDDVFITVDWLNGMMGCVL